MEVSDTTELETVAAQRSEINARQELDRVPEIEQLPQQRGTKRAAPDDATDDEEQGDGEDDVQIYTESADVTRPLSKNQQKKLRRKQHMLATKPERRKLHKEKRRRQREQQQLEDEAEVAAAAAEGRDPVLHERRPAKRQKLEPKDRQQVPVTVILDCQFESYMAEHEIISLSNQVTRCYSDNRNARFPVHMYVSSFGGEIKKRYETTMRNQYKSWKGVHFVGGDFVEAADKAKEGMRGADGGQNIEVLNKSSAGDSLSLSHSIQEPKKKSRKPEILPEPEADHVDKSIVYLTADSPYTLERLEPNTCYVIGGIIDKNREKGLCYKVARDRNVRTAKLPIGEFMVMQSRHILATNHVMEIMLRWLESGDWGAAFMKVIPTRKGGKLKEEENEEVPDQAASEVQLPDNTVEDENDVAKAEDAPSGVDSDHVVDGLEKNALDQQRWSAPPPDPEKVEDIAGQELVGRAGSVGTQSH